MENIGLALEKQRTERMAQNRKRTEKHWCAKEKRRRDMEWIGYESLRDGKATI